MQTNPSPLRFETKQAAEAFINTTTAYGFAHPSRGGFIAVVMHEGGMWALTSQDRMVLLPEW